MPVELLHRLRDEIRRRGPLRFDRYLRIALYEQPWGYYCSRVPGSGSDYRTSPSLTPWFGRLVAEDLRRRWERLDRPPEFSVIEAGAGSGDLAAAAIEAADGDFGRSLRWVFVEPIPAIAQLQRERVPAQDRLRWVDDLTELEPAPGVVLANEVLDNFPFRVLEVTPDGPRDVMVDWAQGGLIETLGEATSEPLASDAASHLQPGDRFEIHCGLEQWCRDAAGVLQAGSLLVVDYGDVEPHIWSRRPSGTMVTYRAGRLGVSPLEDPGDADITAHVNFSALERAAAAAGLRPQPVLTQREWLLDLGLGELIDAIRGREASALEQQRHDLYLELVAQRSRAAALGNAAGLGRLRVFTAWR